MNIFTTSDNPMLCAAWLDDKRVNKMLVETCQMLSSTVRFYGVWSDDRIYRTSYLNHPCTKWVRSRYANYVWLCAHGMALSQWYSDVYCRRHKSHAVLLACWDYRHLLPSDGEKENVVEPFANCTPYKDNEDTTDAYRMFMVSKWRTKDTIAPTWHGRSKPDWYDIYLPLVLSQNPST
jgi:hypothetical protein